MGFKTVSKEFVFKNCSGIELISFYRMALYNISLKIVEFQVFSNSTNQAPTREGFYPFERYNFISQMAS